MDQLNCSNTILGLDLGTNSIGWALLSATDGEPTGILDSGVRVFPIAANEEKGATYAKGKSKPQGQERNRAISSRRQTDRKKRRMAKTANLLQKSGLLPPGDVSGALSRHTILNRIDEELRQRWLTKCDHARTLIHNQLLHFLRDQSLSTELAPYEIGRVLYHLSQKRGFLGSRLTGGEEIRKKGEIRDKIFAIKQRLDAKDLTVGQLLSTQNPHESRIRGQYTHRKMIQTEFNRIWTFQAQFHPQLLTENLRKQIFDTVFHVRPPKSQAHLVGECELEKNGIKRARRASIQSQQFRILSQLAHTRFVGSDGIEYPLEQQQRDLLFKYLDRSDSLDFEKARKLLNVDPNARFNFEKFYETKFLGNTTNALLSKSGKNQIFGKRWFTISEPIRSAIVDNILTIESDEELEALATSEWGLSDQESENLLRAQFENGYLNLSAEATSKLAPLLSQGISYSSAVKQVYPSKASTSVTHLRPVNVSIPELRNPVVHRTLTELRKVVNNIIAKHGLPGKIRVELARDIRNSKKQREHAIEKSEQNRLNNELARKALADADIPPTGSNITKYLLYKECRTQCPYTGNPIGWSDLFIDGKYQIEHIIPFSRMPDNSYANLTLCDHKFNLQKSNLAPSELLSHDSDMWHQVMNRVSAFTGPMRAEKLKRFQLADDALANFIDGFRSSQLNDTRYASKLALRYLAELYGGFWDSEHNQRIQVSRGGITAELRSAWKMPSVLFDKPTNKRVDHRHHAVDAVAIACTSPKTLQDVCEAAIRAERDGNKRFWNYLSIPWPSFIEDISPTIRNIIVSHRVDKKLQGKMHDDNPLTAKAIPRQSSNAASPGKIESRPMRRIRVPLRSLNEKSISSIVDDSIQDEVRRCFNLAGKDIKKLTSSEFPEFNPKLGGKTPIKRVRVWRNVYTVKIGSGMNERNVEPGENSHLEIFARYDEHGVATEFEARLVSRLEAMARKRETGCSIDRTCTPPWKWVCSITKGDSFEISPSGKKRQICIVKNISQEKLTKRNPRVEIVPHFDASVKLRTSSSHGSPDDIEETTAEPIEYAFDSISPKRITKSLESLRKAGFRKVTVTPLGEVYSAND